MAQHLLDRMRSLGDEYRSLKRRRDEVDERLDELERDILALNNALEVEARQRPVKVKAVTIHF